MTDSDVNIDRAIEADIIRTLKEIGFCSSLEDWRDARPVFDPENSTLTMLGHPVMQAWERPYMKRLAEIASSRSRGERLLEVGFGLGISSGYIQENPPGEHWIIEMNKEIAELARRFASGHTSKVRILEGFWQDIAPALESNSFMGILFDTYPLTDGEVDVIFHPFLKHAHRLLKKGGILTYFSDEATWFSDSHLASLREAGFSNVDGELCEINPPADCQYWRQPTMLAPIVVK